jgi:hypothetical protein
MYIFLHFPVPGLAADLTGIVVTVLAGDTVNVLHNGQAEL